jgi:hypothetical protein
VENIGLGLEQHRNGHIIWERIFALDKLDLYATVGANRERGIDLRVPDERNVICVGF